MDKYVKSFTLLERLANSLYERGVLRDSPISFNAKELNIVESFIDDLVKEIEVNTQDESTVLGTNNKGS